MWFFYLTVSEMHRVRQRTVLVHRIQGRLIDSLLEPQDWHAELPDTWRLLAAPHPPPFHSSRAPFFFSWCLFAAHGPYLTSLSSYQQRGPDLPQFKFEKCQSRNLMGQLGSRLICSGCGDGSSKEQGSSLFVWKRMKCLKKNKKPKKIEKHSLKHFRG